MFYQCTISYGDQEVYVKFMSFLEFSDFRSNKTEDLVLIIIDSRWESFLLLLANKRQSFTCLFMKIFQRTLKSQHHTE